MPEGVITGYQRLIDVAGNFDTSSGIFTVGNKDEETGIYTFFYAGWKNPGYLGAITVSKNDEIIQLNMEDDREHTLQINGMFSLNLEKGDKVKLSNQFAGSIDIRKTRPFTFTGYKV